MAIADFTLQLTIKGNKEQQDSYLSIFKEYLVGKNDVYFSAERTQTATEDTVEISASGPYGRFVKLNDIPLFREMAEAAPNGEFRGEITGFTSYTEQSLKCILKNGILQIDTYFEANESAADEYVVYYTTKLPYEKFVKLFKLDSDEFDDYAYDEFICNCLTTGDSHIIGMEYDDLMEELGADLDEEAFDGIIEKIQKLGIVGFETFCETNETGDKRHLEYDPIQKRYINNPAPIATMSAGGAMNAKDVMIAYLKENGLPYDDTTIAKLTQDDFFSILAGTYGKNTPENDDEDEDDE